MISPPRRLRFQATLRGYSDAFVSKLNPAGSALLYSTYLGGRSDDAGRRIAVDASGNTYVSGATSSYNFPATPGAFQATFGGGWDAFVSKLNAAGTALIYSTYLGGSAGEGASAIVVDASGSAYVTGYTNSSDFPTTPGAFQTTRGGAFVTKLYAAGSALLYSTYLGGDNAVGLAIAVDASDNTYIPGCALPQFPHHTRRLPDHICGSDGNALVTKLNAAGSAPLYSTYLGGSNTTCGVGIAIDASGTSSGPGPSASRRE